jgi:hypothetical protein
MNNTTLQLKIKQRLNKLASQDYDNIGCWQIIEAFNKGQLQWVRRQIMGINQLQEAAEQSTIKIGDLQKLLTEVDLFLTIGDKYEYSQELPSNFLHHNRIEASVKKECCPEPTSIYVYLAEEANVPALLENDLTNPNFQWGETFGTYAGNKFRIYTNNEFEVYKAKLMYYRSPDKVQITGCVDPYTLQESTTDVECEFKDDIAEILVDEAAKILAGDIESINQYQIQAGSVNNNT